MMRSDLYRSATAPFFVGALAVAVLAFAPSAALAQHGGGGGGHMGGGGGGGHFGGGGSASSHASAPAASHSSAKPATRSAPVTNSRPAVATSARQTLFGKPASSGSGTALALHAQSAAPRTNVVGFPPSESHTWQAAPAHSGPVTFSGQGHEIWQDSPSRSGNTVTNAAPMASNPTPFAGRTSEATVRPIPPHKIFFPGGSAPIIFAPGFGFFGGGYGFGYFGNGFGCDPFFGWGLNQGFGCNGFGYGYSGYYGPGYGYNYAPGYDSSYSVGQSSADSSSDASSDGYGAYSGTNPSLQDSNAAPNDATPNDGDAATSVNAAPGATAAPTPPTTIYMKDGSSYQVMSYWLDAGKLHYITNYGGESSIDMSQLDLQRTVDENAAHGGSFTLLPAPATDAAPAQPAPDATPAPAPSPTPQQ